METESLRHLGNVDIARICLDHFQPSDRNFVHMAAKSKTNPLVGLAHVKQSLRLDPLKAYCGTTYKPVILPGRKYVSNAESNLKLKAPIITTMNHFESDGYVDHAILYGIKQIQRTRPIGLNSKVIVARWEKYTGKKAVLLNG